MVLKRSLKFLNLISWSLQKACYLQVEISYALWYLCRKLVKLLGFLFFCFFLRKRGFKLSSYSVVFSHHIMRHKLPSAGHFSLSVTVDLRYFPVKNVQGCKQCEGDTDKPWALQGLNLKVLTWSVLSRFMML